MELAILRRGKPPGVPLHFIQVPLDKDGNMANVKDDEVGLPEDSEGETKVDKMGRLQGDRGPEGETVKIYER